MGKRLITQRRGKGTPRYRSPSHRFKGKVRYPTNNSERVSGQVVELIHDPGRTAPLARILLEDFREIKNIAPEGIKEGDWITLGEGEETNRGDIKKLGDIAEGTMVYNIESRPGDGGKLVRSAGSTAYVVSHDKKTGKTYIRLPSKRITEVNSNSRATVGRVAGRGRKSKSLAHAGQAYHAKKTRNRIYPIVKGVSMNAVDHPHGGSHSNVGKSTTVSRNAPPGRKVGHIAAKRTGRRKK